MSFAEYRALDRVSQSDLKACMSNAQLWYETNVTKKYAKPDAPHFQFGKDVESHLKSRGDKGTLTIAPTEVLTANGQKRGKKWEEFKAANDGARIVTEKEHDELYGSLDTILQNVLEHRFAKALLYASDVEWSVRYAWSDGDLDLKCEIDILRAETCAVVDVKTAKDIAPKRFAQAVVDFGYDVQAAHYLDAVAREHSGEVFRYYWVVIRNSAPFDVAVYQMSNEVLGYGQERLEEYKTWFRHCRDSDVWRSPGHNEIETLHLPPWIARTR